MNPQNDLRRLLRVSERTRGIVTKIDGASVTVSVDGASATYQATGLYIGDEVVIQDGKLVRVGVAVDVVEV